MAPFDQDNLSDGTDAVHYRGNRDPSERMLDMKDEQICELRNDLAKKEKQMTERNKETKDELSKKEMEFRDAFAKKDQDWSEKVEELRGQLGSKDQEVYYA